MIDINLAKQYKEFEIKVRYSCPDIGITALLGRSGSGKTSVINMIAGLTRPDNGHIIINDRCVYDSGKKIHIAPEKRRFGYVFQEGRLFPHLSVMSNLTYGMKLVPVDERYIEIDQVVDLLDLSSLLNRRPAKLSGGEKQRVAMGRALLTSPYLLLMDEPLASLDEARKNEVLPFIKRLSTNLSIPVLYVTHSMDEILMIAKKILVLSHGSLKAAGKTRDILSMDYFQEITGAMALKN
ncbi:MULTISPECIES: molybdenum ABC transporter ATP-binding protein [Desulfobacula]|uniref:ModC2: molybdate ABC transporter, ATP-binding protein n=2 Tax=Desulfobacula TaxID=28222 RepID=K0NQM7_DESTT|nr:MULTISPECIES: molybdenum ABC transporter ATP-binding protein [Desulfobacula]CCK82453.1 ModC2: molybdate ABC transporter, ATP-binding protein [Desulfobacula toluolica Tol2]SDU49988.1 molybdate transport system ATP-binding protein [Desulfobacula phenolica]